MKKRLFQYYIIISITAYLILVIKPYSVDFKNVKTNNSICENSPKGKSLEMQYKANQIPEIELFSSEHNSKQEIPTRKKRDNYDIKQVDKTIDAAVIFYSIIMMYPPVDGYENMIMNRNRIRKPGAKHKTRGVIISSGYGD
ncbi:MAG: hypothetical protein A2W99_16540 [Bacteroidetes bacterium GWF2_33_16]|nr:MAG: hypothetical protein A2X00_14255 [Bacteroidetes bacterium GWE2_32_14]OFY03358.1 MAG: hypothetical protein A2W99_16540 [Bacteroidetes bacterium GWF2_33_16]